MASQFPARISTEIGQGIKKSGVFTEPDQVKLVVGKDRFLQPSLEIPGGHKFVWPGGTEGIRIDGAATLAEHKYIGDNHLAVEVTHRDARRINLSGMFAGKSAAYNVRQLLDVITSAQPRGGKLLSVPGVFIKQQRVAVETYSFEHLEGTKDDSFTYEIAFVDFGTAAKLPKINEIILRAWLVPAQSTVPDRGKSQRTFIVKSGVNTLRGIAKVVYNDPNRWDDIYHKNGKVLNGLNVAVHKLPTTILPVGLHLKY